ncbi:ABC transporter permease [Actinoplanes sp. SE50]|uniref:carbohydrate ABC transporter permease n=1 Tax=unclassified Actinoplanes TaxID=2626549 RepID=UPI00006CA2DB|nr:MULTISPECIES: sugar ABC transporter permease [unclassified Actinoplanes]AEV84581.1 ABC transporter membrane protein [Actinoplanes sp. SE50/110]ATO82973.1 ABC transporter permease [Actinoplanes sp. SE50]CAJ81033.1 ABC transporter membrane protein AcbF [Actinoplanes sp. SE50/110]SLM00381.1 ABC-type galactose transporter, permease component [Actinoplanes sp. SE50/110]
MTPTIRPAPAARRRRRTLTRRDVAVAAAMLGVPLLLDLAFIWFPALASVLLSFTKWTGIGSIRMRSCADFPSAPGIPQPGCLNGVDNYRQAFTNYPDFWPAVRHNAIWLVVFILLATPLGMLFAVVIDRGVRGSRFYQSVLFLPVMLSLALIGIIWELIYSPNFGLINTVLGHNHNDNLIDWLGNPRLNLWALLVEASWRQAPYVMVLYLAGLKAVDPALREAAIVDGANAWQTFWRVVFPAMRPINIVVLVVTVIESLRAFDLVYITSNGNPLRGLELLSVAVTQNIVGETQRIGFGSTLGVVLLVISLVPISLFLWQAFRREER